jgi:precorrin-2 dehydrogenase / sirohydrochlorin ferrochelatase
MSPFGYPVLVDLVGRRCVVVGSLPVREGKVEGLLAGGATDVLVVATGPTDRIAELELLEGVRVVRRDWYASDFTGAFLVIAHDPEPAVRARIAIAARAGGALVNVVDDIAPCDWAAPAIVRRGELLVAIGTGGASPALSKKLRERLQDEFGPEWAEVVRVLREVREETIPLLPDLGERSRRWQLALDLDEAAALIREGAADELRARLRARLLEGVTAT